MAQSAGVLDPPINSTASQRTLSSSEEKRFETSIRRLSHRRLHVGKERVKDKEVSALDPRRPSFASKVYLGSYGKSRRNSHQTSRHGSESVNRRAFLQSSPRASGSHLQLEHLLDEVDVETDTFGVNEMRDGFFDASFYRPSKHNNEEMNRKAIETLPISFKKLKTLSGTQSLMMQWKSFVSVCRDIMMTRSGIRLLRSCLGFFVAYVICLIPLSRDWLGRYNYILVVSAILNHSGRPLGSQIDGTILTILGAAAGLGWGSLALYVSTSTSEARTGYGGILATFLILFTAVVAWLRCVFFRFYQAVVCAGIAICYTCLADTSDSIGWAKIAAYGIPWVLGQAISLTVNLFVLPAAGTRPLA